MVHIPPYQFNTARSRTLLSMPSTSDTDSGIFRLHTSSDVEGNTVLMVFLYAVWMLVPLVISICLLVGTYLKLHGYLLSDSLLIPRGFGAKLLSGHNLLVFPQCVWGLPFFFISHHLWSQYTVNRDCNFFFSITKKEVLSAWLLPTFGVINSDRPVRSCIKLMQLVKLLALNKDTVNFILPERVCIKMNKNYCLFRINNMYW